MLNALVIIGGLGDRDVVDEEANAALGDDVGHTVAELDGDDRAGAIQAEHREDVHDRVRAPRDHGRPADPCELQGDLLVLLLCDSTLQADEEGVHNVQEGDHREGPPHPADVEVALDDELAGVAEDNHDAGGNAEGGRLRRGIVGWELHDEDDLNHEERHGEHPVHVPVRVVEWLAGDHRVLDDAIDSVWVTVGLIPRVEDADVVVGGNECDQAPARGTTRESSTYSSVQDR